MDAHERSPLSFHSFLSQLPSFSSFFILYTCTSETWSMGCTWSRRLTDSLLGRIWGRDDRSMGSLDRITSILLVNHPADTRPSWSAASFLPYDDSDQPPSPHLYQRSRKGRKGYDSISYDHTHHVIHVQVHISLTAGSSKWLVHSHDTPTQHTRHVPSVRRERERPRGTLGGHRSHHVVSYVHWCTIVSLHMCVYMYLCMYTVDNHLFWISSSSLHHTYIHGVATSQRRNVATKRNAMPAMPARHACLPACTRGGRGHSRGGPRRWRVRVRIQ